MASPIAANGLATSRMAVADGPTSRVNIRSIPTICTDIETVIATRIRNIVESIPTGIPRACATSGSKELKRSGRKIILRTHKVIRLNSTVIQTFVLLIPNIVPKRILYACSAYPLYKNKKSTPQASASVKIIPIVISRSRSSFPKNP